MLDNYNFLSNFFNENHVPVFGIADLKEYTKSLGEDQIHPFFYKVSKDLVNAVSFGCKLSYKVVDTIDDEPNPLYAFHYRRINQLLDNLEIKLTTHIEQRGYNALPIPASQVVDFKKMTAHLSHRHIAYLAGLGWYGRNNLLVNEHYGSHLRFATILTDMPLPINEPLKNDCGACKACVNACPANAIHNSFEDFNKDDCQAKLKEFSKIPGISHYICGICVKACKGKHFGKR
ncbi:hypothetical protein BVX93_00880 [bacterium B13(2017)]|nr:hypothetical protein BVX93_00880 [bacterium B13(2017)]